MIEVNGIIPWSAAERSTYAELPAREINVAARDLRRSVDFYTRVFGFRAISEQGGGTPVIMSATARADLIIHELRGPVFEPAPFVRAWGFVVTDLDRVRQKTWDLGIRIARDSGAPDQIYRWSNGRSLYIRAPDGNEIELVEIRSGALERFAGRNPAPNAGFRPVRYALQLSDPVVGKVADMT